MRLVSMRAFAMLAAVHVLSCGGQVAGAGSDGGGNPGNTGPSGNPSGVDGSSPGNPLPQQPDASRTIPGVTCSTLKAGVSTDGGACDMTGSETCTDGTTYSVSCSCPAATCSCSQLSAQGGGSGGGTSFTGCADHCSGASLALAYAACGFPH